MRRALPAGLLVALVAALVTLAGGPAWADPELRLTPASGPAGAPVVISGSGFAAAEIEIHWNSRTGALLTAATGPEFSVTATVPDAVPNSYQVVAVVRGPNGVSTSSTSYQVLPAGASVETTTTTAVPPGRDPVAGGADATTTTTVAARAPAPAPAGRGSDTPAPASRVSGVDGGLDPGQPRTTGDDGPSPLGMAGTVESDRPGTPAGGSLPAGTTGGVGAAGAIIPGAFGGVGAEAARPPTSGAPGAISGRAGSATGIDTNLAGGEGSDRALGPAPTNAVSRRVQSPVLLFVGLGLLLAGGGVLAIRKHRGLDP